MHQQTPGEINVSTTLNLPSYKQEAVRHILLGEYQKVGESLETRAIA